MPVEPRWPHDEIVVHVSHPDPLLLEKFGLYPVRTAGEKENKLLEQVKVSAGIGVPHIGRYGHGVSLTTAIKRGKIYMPQTSAVHVFTRPPFKGNAVVGRYTILYGHWEPFVVQLNAEKNRTGKIKVTVSVNGKKLTDPEVVREIVELFNENSYLSKVGINSQVIGNVHEITERALFFRYRNPPSIEELVSSPWSVLDRIRRLLLPFYPS